LILHVFTKKNISKPALKMLCNQAVQSNLTL